MKRNTTLTLSILLGILLIVLAACGGSGDTPADTNAPAVEADAPAVEAPVAEEPAVEEEPVAELFGDALRGGLLYDKWWKPLGLDAPEADHPLWATQDNNTRSGGDTWRCKECHGWDYKGVNGAYGGGSHMTGFDGIIQLAGGDPNVVLAAMMGETNPDHDFSAVMDEQALIDISLFIAQEIIDYSAAVSDEKVAVSTDTATGDTLYADTCAECHGPEGLAINFGKLASDVDYVSAIANGNPWEFLHKARFGQPGSAMPSVIDAGWTFEEQSALLAYAQTLPNESLATQGGQLWDKWWKALGLDEPVGDQALWATQDANTRDGKDTWRCKECHGWDYKGADGAYAGGSHFTGFAGVLGSAADLTSWLDGSANADHDFSMYLDESAIAMLVAFMQDGQIDMSLYVNYEDKSLYGDAAAGEALYQIGCERCHGEDGKAINFGDDDDPTYLGDVAASNPWETLHKAANGQPGTAMPSGLNLGWSWQDLTDVVTFVQTLASK